AAQQVQATRRGARRKADEHPAPDSHMRAVSSDNGIVRACARSQYLDVILNRRGTGRVQLIRNARHTSQRRTRDRQKAQAYTQDPSRSSNDPQISHSGLLPGYALARAQPQMLPYVALRW